MRKLICSKVGDALIDLKVNEFDVCFMDPPDNIGLVYNEYHDYRVDYSAWLMSVIAGAAHRSRTTWVSFNARWVTHLDYRVLDGFEIRIMPQTFTFGQYRETDFGNNWRPLLRVKLCADPFYAGMIRVPSARQEAGDPRAAGPRVPGDVFDFPRVTGNSSQRRKWHPTQLHEGLVERCLLSAAGPKGNVLDLFSGTGTTMRVCTKLGLDCLSVEMDADYCALIAEDNGLTQRSKNTWSDE